MGIVTAESALPPARALLDHRQASFALRLLSRPVGRGGQEEILEKRDSSLTARIKERCGIRRGETAEVQAWEEFKEMRARVIVEKKEETLKVAKGWTNQQRTIWTDGSRLEGGEVGAAIAFRENCTWTRKGTYLGKNKEVFDTEVYAICQALETLDSRNEMGQSYTIFSHSHAAICRVQHDRTGPGQAQARGAI